MNNIQDAIGMHKISTLHICLSMEVQLTGCIKQETAPLLGNAVSRALGLGNQS
jgi:hypothetical protein